MLKRDMAIGAAVAALLMAPLPACAADVQGEITTAATHAELAAKASDLNATQMHLHHALNCLVGPGGAGFDAKNINPCAGSGNGAIPDTADAGKKKALQAAASTAEAGLAAKDLATAQADAAKTASELHAVK